MADRKNGGMLQPTPYNETTGGQSSADYDESGGGIYGDWKADVLMAHLSQAGADLEASANMRSGGGIMGGPAPGEPNPAGFSGTAESKK
jgi:hypothetical protein